MKFKNNFMFAWLASVLYPFAWILNFTDSGPRWLQFVLLMVGFTFLLIGDRLSSDNVSYTKDLELRIKSLEDKIK